ncbi:MAG: nucleotidyltransferase domain-containing protein [Armatimonadetes bacterium]|nr:nucleotidyltransferase domain-containing protein [Armatimonadota bacterium]
MKAAADLQMSPDLRAVLDEALQRIIEVAQPQAVILFGSHAEGRARVGSDLDFLVIADTEETGKLEADLYGAMADLARGRWREFPSVDIIVLTPAEYEYEAQLPGLTIWRARRHGVVLYERAA